MPARGSRETLHGDGGAPLSDTVLAVTAAPPLTDGADELVVFYSGHVEVGQRIAVGSTEGGDVVIGLEAIGWGDGAVRMATVRGDVTQNTAIAPAQCERGDAGLRIPAEKHRL